MIKVISLSAFLLVAQLLISCRRDTEEPITYIYDLYDYSGQLIDSNSFELALREECSAYHLTMRQDGKVLFKDKVLIEDTSRGVFVATKFGKKLLYPFGDSTRHTYQHFKFGECLFPPIINYQIWFMSKNSYTTTKGKYTVYKYDALNNSHEQFTVFYLRGGIFLLMNSVDFGYYRLRKGAHTKLDELIELIMKMDTLVEPPINQVIDYQDIGLPPG